ncbi:hypothetical protein I8J34_23855 [Denitromonas sp. IR12]|uniref:Uncharacterized protein n=1 Tax=Denitromonas iodatirespirans TaxID=2795389 RepID=A0A944DJR7_DENI1|nr:hypothetical protein [Denitromonas iodatirespirans]
MSSDINKILFIHHSTERLKHRIGEDGGFFAFFAKKVTALPNPSDLTC